MTGVQTCALPICFPVTIEYPDDIDIGKPFPPIRTGSPDDIGKPFPPITVSPDDIGKPFSPITVSPASNIGKSTSISTGTLSGLHGAVNVPAFSITSLVSCPSPFNI